MVRGERGIGRGEIVFLRRSSKSDLQSSTAVEEGEIVKKHEG